MQSLAKKKQFIIFKSYQMQFNKNFLKKFKQQVIKFKCLIKKSVQNLKLKIKINFKINLKRVKIIKI